MLRHLAVTTASTCLALVAAAPPAGAQPASGGAGATAQRATTYSISQKFLIASGDNQGMAFGGGVWWVCYDVGGGNGKIIGYDANGRIVKQSGSLPLGHCAELAYRKVDGTLWTVDYKNGTTDHFRVVDMSLAKPAVVKTIDVTKYGLKNAVAIDNVKDEVILRSKGAAYDFNVFDVSGTKGGTAIKWLRKFSYTGSLGTPQGLEVVGKDLLFLSSLDTDPSQPGFDETRITTFSMSGAVKGRIKFAVNREPEGLAVDPNKVVYFGYHSPNAVMKMSPAYVPLIP